jgi:hypothetical protein
MTKVQSMKHEVTAQQSSIFKTIRQFSEDNPAFPEGGIRHAIFYRGKELEMQGAIVSFGRKRLINEKKWLQLTADGFFNQIAGVAR